MSITDAPHSRDESTQTTDLHVHIFVYQKKVPFDMGHQMLNNAYHVMLPLLLSFQENPLQLNIQVQY